MRRVGIGWGKGGRRKGMEVKKEQGKTVRNH